MGHQYTLFPVLKGPFIGLFGNGTFSAEIPVLLFFKTPLRFGLGWKNGSFRAENQTHRPFEPNVFVGRAESSKPDIALKFTVYSPRPDSSPFHGRNK